MKKIECYIVQDLLPLYIDHACSKQTTEDIEGHLQSCESCKKLYEEMSSDICSALQTPEFDSRKIFRHAKKSVLAIILALAAVISCFVINAGGAWMGGRADISNLIVTILYVIFWSVFSVRSRGYVPLIKVSFAISCITFVSAAAGLITGNVADLDAAGRVAAGQRQRIGKNAVRYLVAVDRLRGLALSIRAADRGLHSVQQRIAQFKAHVAGIAEDIGKRQVFETSVAFLIAGLHGQGIFDRRGAVRDA